MPHAYILTAPRTLEWREYEDPPLGPRDVRLQSLISGISHGTEMNLYLGFSPFYNRGALKEEDVLQKVQER